MRSVMVLGLVGILIETSTCQADLDGDGWTVEAGDCDDGEAQIYPGAAETCNGLDDDCDGAIDDGVALVGWPDEDQDGWHGGWPVQTCDVALPDGYETDALDGDDLDPAVNPDALEVCDGGLDNDCDGLADDLQAWADQDRDTYGDPTVTRQACPTDTSWVLNGDDCDDLDPSTHPGAYPVEDGTDHDCDGDLDCCRECDPAKSKPCGDGCITKSETCSLPPGCSCVKVSEK